LLAHALRNPHPYPASARYNIVCVRFALRCGFVLPTPHHHAARCSQCPLRCAVAHLPTCPPSPPVTPQVDAPPSSTLPWYIPTTFYPVAGCSCTTTLTHAARLLPGNCLPLLAAIHSGGFGRDAFSSRYSCAGSGFTWFDVARLPAGGTTLRMGMLLAHACPTFANSCLLVGRMTCCKLPDKRLRVYGNSTTNHYACVVAAFTR